MLPISLEMFCETEDPFTLLPHCLSLFILTFDFSSSFLLSLWLYKSEVAQSCLTLCDPMDYSLPGSSIHRIFQARILEWVAISFSRRSSQPRDWTQVSHIVSRCFTVWATREVIKNLASKITRWLFWGASLPSSRSAGFLNKVIFLASTLHLGFIGLSCCEQSKFGLDNKLA